jgi:hypothetical protein
MELAVYELQEQVKELLKRVEELEAERCRCATCQMRDLLDWRDREEGK